MLGNLKDLRQLFLQVDNNYADITKKKITYTVPQAGKISIKIYALNGKEELTIMNEYKTSGTFDCFADLSKLGTGVYNCEIKSGEQKYSRELYILK